MGKYNQVIRQYPTSNKIGDAAYRIGDAHEHFKEYSIAALYFERAAQWDKNIKYPRVSRPHIFMTGFFTTDKRHSRSIRSRWRPKRVTDHTAKNEFLN